MNREIKFEYVWKDEKTGHIINETWTLDEIANGRCYETFTDAPLHRNYRLIAKRQYTGVPDKNGKNICEGDLRANGDWACYSEAWGKFGWTDGGYILDLKSKEDEVVGNIYENPELQNQ